MEESTNEIPNPSRISTTKSVTFEENGKTSDEKDLNLEAFKPIKTKQLNYMKRKVKYNFKKKKECENSIVDQQIKNEFKILDTKLNSAEETILSDLLDQSVRFEENKLKRMKKQKNKPNLVSPITKRNSSNKGRRGSKIDGIFESLSKFIFVS